MVLPLTYISSGQQARIVWVASAPDTRQYLADLGFAPEALLYCIIPPSRRGMGAYRIRGTVIALPKAIANEIFAKLLSSDFSF